MARFTTRVELIDGEAEDYNTLHQEMENRFFTRTIIAEDGTEYYLPPAEYNRIGNYTREQVLNAAKTAANITGKESRILVTPTTSRKWSNLERVI